MQKNRSSRAISYRWIRNAHLYIGLFASPFVVILCLSVFYLNHRWDLRERGAAAVRTVHLDAVPQEITDADLAARVRGARQLLPRLGIAGEVNFTSYSRQDNTASFSVSAPGVETSVDVELTPRLATVESRKTGIGGAAVFLHKMPGPHLIAIRGNWLITQVWRWFADSLVYSLLLLSATGIYLWLAVRADRKKGLIFFGLGAVSFWGVLYALCR